MILSRICTALLVAVVLSLPGGAALGQVSLADIDAAKQKLEANPSPANRTVLGTLQYQFGLDLLRSGDMRNAVKALQVSVFTFEDGRGAIPGTDPAFRAARYGYAYALLQNNDNAEGTLVLGQMVRADPGDARAAYLLGTTLMQMGGLGNLSRGAGILGDLSREGEAPYNAMARRTATRLGYNLSTLSHATGNAEMAYDTLSGAVDPVGSGQGASEEENNKVAFGTGVYLMETGDLVGAMDSFEVVHGSNPGFAQKNGLGVGEALSFVYYTAAIEQLKAGGQTAALTAIDFFDRARGYGDKDAVDAHHGKAVAYFVAGDTKNMKREITWLAGKDPAYFEQVKEALGQ